MLMLILTPAGCGDDEEPVIPEVSTTGSSVETTTTTEPTTTSVPPTGSSTTTESSTTTTEISTTTTTEQLSSAETLLPDGTIKALGFIDRVWEEDGVRYLSIDYAEFYTGAEADAAAIEDGVIPPGEHIENDYYIRNVNPMKREFSVSPSVAITTSTRWAPNDGFGAPCTWGEFIGFWGPGPLPDGDIQLPHVPWWIVRDGPEVINIDEQYVP